MNAGRMLPFALPRMPGVGGRIKTRPEDFRVEEIPAYLPCGSGEHLFIEVEKCNLSTPRLISHVAHVLGLPAGRIGYAGLKDAQAITRQWISIHHAADLPLEGLESDHVRILRRGRHGNKLRLGHLLGNRFSVVVRGISPVGGKETSPAGEMDAMLTALAAGGFPNYFGPQRFGPDGDNAQRGKELLRRGFAAKMPIARIRYLTNAYQSALFNEIVGIRLLESEDYTSLQVGDLAVLHANGASFQVTAENLADSARRCGHGEISPSAPLFGYRTTLAQGRPGTWEESMLEREGITLSQFKAGGKRLSPKGERRPVRALPHELVWESFTESGVACLRLSFVLDSGVYATSLLREIMKAESAPNAVEWRTSLLSADPLPGTPLPTAPAPAAPSPAAPLPAEE